jgi:hypothetical protein
VRRRSLSCSTLITRIPCAHKYVNGQNGCRRAHTGAATFWWQTSGAAHTVVAQSATAANGMSAGIIRVASQDESQSLQRDSGADAADAVLTGAVTAGLSRMRSHACISVDIISVAAAAGFEYGGRPLEGSYNNAGGNSGQYRSDQPCINDQVGLATAHADHTCCLLLLSVAYMHMHTLGMR